MQQTTDTRIHPVAALRAMRNLLRDREDTRQVFLLMDALRGKTTLRQLERFRRTPVGRAKLGERACLLDRLSDRETLKALPAGTLGRAYYEFMASENLSADGLVEASQLPSAPSDDVIWFRERTREMHDLLHIVSGYGRSPLGEACLAAFSYAQIRQKGFALIALVAMRRVARALPGLPGRRAIFEGYRRGRAAAWLIGADWEVLLETPVEEIRAQFAVPPARWYPKLVAAIRERGLALPGAAQPMPAAPG